MIVAALAAATCSTPVRTRSSNGTAASRHPAPIAARPQTASDYTRLESEVLIELNSARTNPAAYAAHLEPLLSQFRGNVLEHPGWHAGVRTQEGPAAVREAIGALRAQPPVAPVTGSSALAAAARDLATLQQSGATGHTGSDGSTPETRISAHGKWGRAYDENIGYGQFPTGRDVVVDLIVDDGVPGRGHRHNIFDANVHVAGVGCGPHRVYGMVCVIDQAGTFTAK